MTPQLQAMPEKSDLRKQIEAVLLKPAIVQPVSRMLLKQLLAEHDQAIESLRSELEAAL